MRKPSLFRYRGKRRGTIFTAAVLTAALGIQGLPAVSNQIIPSANAEMPSADAWDPANIIDADPFDAGQTPTKDELNRLKSSIWGAAQFADRANVNAADLRAHWRDTQVPAGTILYMRYEKPDGSWSKIHKTMVRESDFENVNVYAFKFKDGQPTLKNSATTPGSSNIQFMLGEDNVANNPEIGEPMALVRSNPGGNVFDPKNENTVKIHEYFTDPHSGNEVTWGQTMVKVYQASPAATQLRDQIVDEPTSGNVRFYSGKVWVDTMNSTESENNWGGQNDSSDNGVKFDSGIDTPAAGMTVYQAVPNLEAYRELNEIRQQTNQGRDAFRHDGDKLPKRHKLMAEYVRQNPENFTVYKATTNDAGEYTLKSSFEDPKIADYIYMWVEDDEGVKTNLSAWTVPEFRNPWGTDEFLEDGHGWNPYERPYDNGHVPMNTHNAGIDPVPERDSSGSFNNVHFALAGTTKGNSHTVIVIKEDKDNFDPKYKEATAPQGKETVIAPPTDANGKDIPEDTTFEKKNSDVPGTVKVDPKTGEITVTPKKDAKDGDYEVTVEVTYPDGSKEDVTAKVTVPKLDTDGDGTPDDEDTDDDNDGISDADENTDPNLNPKNPDSDGDGTNDGDEDQDGDGIKNKDESDETSGDTTDTDGDNTPDINDKDSDGDGVSDADENTDPNLDPKNPDTDGDNTNDGDEDQDGDGIKNKDESTTPDEDENHTGITDTDGDKTPDINDKDSDGDGVNDADENATDGLDPTNPDTDGDGTGDGQEDWDEDEKPNADESITPDEDPDHEGITDKDPENGKPDLQDGKPNTDGGDKPDNDNDGIPDDEDTDDDNDGVSDADEETDPNLDPKNPDTDGDNTNDGDEDQDGDGIKNKDESDETSGDTTDTDGDNTPDINDKDSDGDGVSDADENATDGLDPTNPDTDGDGTGDGQEDWDEDGKPNADESITPDEDPDHEGITDKDPKNGKPDLQDGKPDNDGDGIPDDEDTDDDNDGISDADEETDPNLDPKNPDTDGDGTNDGDEDQDGDGIKNKDESDETSGDTTDTDGDNTPDINDKDSDGDGVNDADENATPGLDPQDPDTDGDGTGDGEEDWDGDGENNADESITDDEDPNHTGITDENNNGKPDLQDNDNPTPDNAAENTPSYDPTKGKAGVATQIEQTGDKDLPAGTTAEIGKAPEGWSIEVDSATGDLTVTSPADANPGTVITIPVSFTYPDGSDEVANAKFTVEDKDSSLHNPTYPTAEAPRGEESDPVLPNNADKLPSGTTFAPGAGADQFPGTVEIDSNTGAATFTPNVDAPITKITVPVEVTYPDGSTDVTGIKVNVTDPDGTDASNYSPGYDPKKAAPGQTVEFKQKETNLPSGTTFVKPNGIPAGYRIDINDKGDITVVIPNDAKDAKINFPVVVQYPDGSSETATAKLTVESKTRSVGSTNAQDYDPTYGKPQVTPRGKTTVIPAPNDKNGKDLPADTTFAPGSGVDRFPGQFEVDPNTGAIKVTPNKDATPGSYTFPVKVTYPDNSTESIPVTATVTREPEDKNITVKPGTKITIDTDGSNPIADGGITGPDGNPVAPGTVQITEGNNGVDIIFDEGAKPGDYVITLEDGTKIIITVTPGGDKTPPAPAGSSSINEQCVASLVGVGVPLLLLIPLGIATQVRLPGLERFQYEVSRAVSDVNSQIQRSMGIFNSDLANAVSKFTGPNFPARDLGTAAFGIALTAIGLLIADKIASNCMDDYDGLSSVANKEGSEGSSAKPKQK
ncbi:Rib/alpha-like domain-containing protein [Corynebacterium phocae]|uniref:Rib/alpha-like domain-containing protein n=1 Tax=Corynebacterium phocae TaxID=161895 RepID=UPI0009520C7E|nr:Rib/alpha-like domain-containing protein [Corynebacterium phocae]KAA8726410.1 hypothetical protein F4V58_02520 [Corynebacterium phocae]